MSCGDQVHRIKGFPPRPWWVGPHAAVLVDREEKNMGTGGVWLLHSVRRCRYLKPILGLRHLFWLARPQRFAQLRAARRRRKIGNISSRAVVHVVEGPIPMMTIVTARHLVSQERDRRGHCRGGHFYCKVARAETETCGRKPVDRTGAECFVPLQRSVVIHLHRHPAGRLTRDQPPSS